MGKLSLKGKVLMKLYHLEDNLKMFSKKGLIECKYKLGLLPFENYERIVVESCALQVSHKITDNCIKMWDEGYSFKKGTWIKEL